LYFGQGGEEVKQPTSDLRTDVNDVASVDEVELVAGEKDVAGVHVTVKGADAEHDSMGELWKKGFPSPRDGLFSPEMIVDEKRFPVCARSVPQIASCYD
jgi:hypothetical protein